ncbi:methyl-accepting chemotaxis protein [Shumkonia mesophila]|uniref:methyl-accepting chemotaxis protein n=1 Tax=Shumkonia mesophila TaxID=2838854 RepID=UPI002934C8BB|nr:methyl-accepting chemotaxis protein [Shumkonia mesophila]
MAIFAGSFAPRRVSARISSKLIVSLAVAISLVFAAIFATFIYAVSVLTQKQDELIQVVQNLNGDLRLNMLDLQKSYLAVPDFLETDPVAAVTAWLKANRQATARDHQGRDAVTARYADRRIRRDLQKPGFFAVEATADGASVSYGLFSNGEYQETARELLVAGAAADAVRQGIDTVVSDMTGPEATKQRILALKSKLADEALAAESTRTAILSAVDGIQAKKTEVQELVQQIDYGVIGLGVTGVFLTILTLHQVTRSVVTSPLQAISSVMTRIVQREGTMVPYLERADEIGAIARGIEEFRTVLAENERFQERQAQEKEIQRRRTEMTEACIAEFNHSAGAIAQTVAQAAKGMQGVAGMMTTTAEEIGTRVTAVSAASDQARNHVETASSAIAQLQTSVAEISRRATDAAHMARDAVNQAKTTDQTVGQLSEMARDVDRIVEIISEIANQTNLLALNATIEAARAGTAGKGFAVVASEVKALASQSAKATGDISSRIQAMRQVTGNSVSAIQTIGEAIKRIDGITSSTVAVVEEERATIQTIFQSMEQTGQVTHKVAHHIQGVGDATARNDSVAREVLDASVALSGQAELLHTRVSKFIEDIRPASSYS